MYLREAVPDNARDAAMMSIKLSMVMGMIVSYVVGGVIDTKLYGELEFAQGPACARELLPF